MNRGEVLKEAKDNFKEYNCNFGSEHARDLILVSNSILVGMGNHLEHISRSLRSTWRSRKGLEMLQIIMSILQ